MRLSDVPGLTQLTLALAMTATFLPTAGAQEAIERRVNELLAQMTLEEKVGQLNLISHGPPLRWEDISEGKAGALLNFNSAPDVARAQALARQSRLKIPPLFGLDVLHGFRTQFPLPLGEAAAFNPRLSRLASEWAAREAAYVGVNWTFAPMADLSRDSRWGRIVEGFGEDPYLGSVLTAARVEGFRAGGLAAAAKHFAGYGAPQGGRDYDTTYIPRAEMYDTYLPPFRAAVEAGSASFMAAFNALNGDALDGQSLASDRCAARAMGLRRLRHLRLGRHRRTHRPRHRGRRRGGRPQGDPRRRRHGHDGPALHQAPARRGARRPGAGKRRSTRRCAGCCAPSSAWACSTVRTSIRPIVDAHLPVAGIAPGRARGGARNLRAAAEPRRRAADPVERPLRSPSSAPSPTRPAIRSGPHAARGHAEDSVTILEGIRRTRRGRRHRRAPCCRPAISFCRNTERPASRPRRGASDPIS